MGHAKKRGGQELPLSVKFERHVVRTPGCWDWKAAKDRKGYPLVSQKGRNRGAHRVAYELFNGPIGAGLFVLHRCDNPSCTNPAHLFLGSQADNMADMRRKARGTQGDSHPNSRLAEFDLADMRVLAAWGMSAYAIAKHYGVSESTIRRRVRGNG